MSLNRSRAIGVVGSLMVAVGVFLPALSFRQAVLASLWDAHPWTACVILASVAFAIFLCGAGRLGWLKITAIGMAAVIAGRTAPEQAEAKQRGEGKGLKAGHKDLREKSCEATCEPDA